MIRTLLISVSNGNNLVVENVRIERIYSYLKIQGKVVDLIYINEKNNVERGFKEKISNYDIFGFSVNHSNLSSVHMLSQLIKSVCDKAYIIIGGMFVTMFYNDIISYEKKMHKHYFDFYVLGDGEYTVLDIINNFEINSEFEIIHKNIKFHKNIVTKESMKNKEPFSIDINELPFPERVFLRNSNYFVAQICDSYGCLGNCSFCSYSSYHHKWCGRTAKSLFQEVLDLNNNTSAKLYIFTGSSFEDPGNKGKEKINDFCDMVIESGLKISFRCYIRANTFKKNDNDIKLLQKMKKAGFNVFFIGIESGNDDDMKIYNKMARVEDNYEIIELLDEIGIFCGEFGFIMFNPYSNLDKIKKNYLFLSEVQSSNLDNYISKIDVIKGTKMYEMLIDDSLLRKKTTKTSIDIAEDYCYANKEISELTNFIHEKFYINSYSYTPEIEKVVFDTGNIAGTINGFSNLFDVEDLISELSKILSEYSKIMKEYFYWLYYKNDIRLCEKIFNEFIRDVFQNHSRMQSLKNKFIRKMLKNKVI